MRPNRRSALRWGTPVVAAAAGLLFVAGARTAAGSDLRPARGGDSAQLVQDATGRADALADRVAELRREVEALSGTADDGTVPQQQLLEATGLAPVSGPGVTVVLDDAPVPDPLPDGATVDDYLVHQQDVEGVLNALWHGGARGVTVMGQRLTTTSAVRCVGPVILLEGRTWSPPYRISAVGDVRRLRAALDDAGAVTTYRQYADALGLGYEVSEERSLRLPAYEGSLSLAHASPVR